jgi:hypothetical protein
MDFTIQRQEAGDGVVVFSLCGWIRAAHLDTLSEMFAREDGKVTLELSEVILHDRVAVRLLGSCQKAGTEELSLFCP